MKLLKKTALACTILVSSLSFGQSNSSCANMEAACASNDPIDAQSGVTAAQITDPGNDYGCLGSTPNPTWYFFEIDQSGDVQFSLSAPSDIDFIIYGPYADVATAQADCGSMSAADIVDCSYSGTANETPEIGPNSSPNGVPVPTTAIAGEVYVMLVTNYANSLQSVDLNQTGGTGSTDCSIVTPDPCISNPGTFAITENGSPVNSVYLCDGESFLIESNDDYILPNDTIFASGAPSGDYTGLPGEVTTAQLMWLVYNGMPDGNNDPDNDPNFMGNPFMIASDDLSGTNSPTDPLFQFLGGVCGTYYFVPVAGDDGDASQFNTTIAGTGDNNGLDWDKDGNGCFLFGPPIEVTFACALEVTPTINCGGPLGNGMDVEITGGVGDYSIVNQGAGNIVSTTVANPGTAQISGLTNNQGWNIDITDTEGCEINASGTFSAPTITGNTITPAASCPGASLGNVEVSVGATGLAPLTVTMNGNNVNATAPNYNFDAVAGTLINVIVTDANGCVVDDGYTVSASDHDIVITTTSDSVSCFGLSDGGASIVAVPTNMNTGVQDGTVQTIDWLFQPTGAVQNGGSSNTFLVTGSAAGTWDVTVEDDFGCIKIVQIEIGQPDELSINVQTSVDPGCYGANDGSIILEANGGVGATTFTWGANNPIWPENGPGLPFGNENSTSTTLNNAIDGTYEATVTDVNGCLSTISIDLEHPLEIIPFITLKDIDCFGDSTGGIIIDSTHFAIQPILYNWDLDLAPDVPNPGQSFNLANGLPPGTYTVTIVDGNGCTKDTTVTLTQNPEVILTPSVQRSALCRNNVILNSPNGQLFAEAQGAVNPDYLWTQDATGATNANPTWGNINTAPGSYTVTSTDAFGCVLTETIVLDSLSPIASFELTSPQFSSDYVGTAPVTVTFENTSENYAFANDPLYNQNTVTDIDTAMIWTFSLNNDPFVTEEVTDLSRVYTEEGLYTVCLKVVENLNQCVDSTCKEIQIYNVPSLTTPNVFTPGGDDDVNNTFFFPNVSIVEFECTVYDRWGKEVFKFTDINDVWDGTNASNGKDCVDGVYFYVYTGDSSNDTHYEGQGNVHLIRN